MHVHAVHCAFLQNESGACRTDNLAVPYHRIVTVVLYQDTAFLRKVGAKCDTQLIT